MGKNKDKAEKAKKKAAKKAAAEFPEVATPAADEKAGTFTRDTDRLSKKDKARIEALEVGVVHDFAEGVEQVHRIGFLVGLEVDEGTKKKVRKAAAKERDGYRERGEALMFEKNREERAAKAETKAKAKAAPVEPEKVVDPEVDAEVAAIKARVQAKRQERYEALIAEGSSEEAARQLSRLQALNTEDPKGKTLGPVGEAIMTAPVNGETPASKPKKGKGKAKAAEPKKEPETVHTVSGAEVPVATQSKAEAAQVAEEVATEAGREFAVGPAATDDGIEDLDPHAADRDADGVRWSKHASPRPYIFRPDGKEALYSRMTSYIDVLDEKGGLQDWKDRMLLVGIARAAAELDPELDAIDIVGAVNRLTDATEGAILKADKSLRKGKITVDEHTAAVEGAEKEYKSKARALVEDMRDRGGAHDKANKGTDLHKVFEDFDNAKMADASLTIDRWIEPGQPGEHLSKSDVRDLRAYRAAVEAAGIEFLACEQRIVLDEYKVTGTLDRSIMATPPGASRRVRMVGDVKTGRMDLGVGKFATQVYGYAMGEGYANSIERVDLKHSKKWGVIFHSPAGQGKTTVWFMDLSKGAEGWKAIETVRAWRRSTTEAQTFRGQGAYMTEGVSALAHDDGTVEVNTPDAE